jgi:hypothetical protein
MCQAEFLDWLDAAVRLIRHRTPPTCPQRPGVGQMRQPEDMAMGGVQLIFCGDFLQLGPVTSKNSDISRPVSLKCIEGTYCAYNTLPPQHTDTANMCMMCITVCFPQS